MPCLEQSSDNSAIVSAPEQGNPSVWHWLDPLERIAAFGILIALMPLLILVGTLIAILSGKTPLIAHRRLGLGGRPLWVLKFRTMWRHEARARGRAALIEYIEEQPGPRLKRAGDRRITSGFARFCRRHSIDELPQLLQVVRGEMSLVGPRPITDAEWNLHYYPRAAEILEVKPGISGLWQTMGRSRLTYEQRRDLDLALVRNRSLKLYFRILVWTLPEIWNGRNAW